jgi:hypothetical protein
MCYGTCKYEGRWSGTCTFATRFPGDATCMMEKYDEEYDEETEEEYEPCTED